MVNKSIIECLSEQLFSLFVVNDNALAVQGNDGLYRTKYFRFDSSIIKLMLEERQSFGFYQQNAKGRIRWICFDFDCKDKNNPDLGRLYKDCITPLLIILREKGYSYLTEFSGRRGIHIWLVFDKTFPKSVGYTVIQDVLRKYRFDETKYGLDLFPATPSAINNKVGKQVKSPLSVHKKGAQSYFFDSCPLDFFSFSIDFAAQFELLEKYKVNSADSIVNRFVLEETRKQYTSKYCIFESNTINGITSCDVIQILNDIEVFKTVFNRIKQGISDTNDLSPLSRQLV